MKLVGEEIQPQAAQSSSGSTGGSSDVGGSSYTEESSSVLQPEYESYADERAKEQEQERINELFGLNNDESTETFVEEEQEALELEEEQAAEEKAAEEQAAEEQAAEEQAAEEKAAEEKAAEEQAAEEKAAQQEAEDALYYGRREAEHETARAVDAAIAEAKQEAEEYKFSTGYDDDTVMSAEDALRRMGSSSIFDSSTLDVMKHFDETSSAAQAITQNEEWKVSMDTDGDGVMEDVNLADAIADSFDSELDLYIQEEVNKVIEKYGHKNDQYLSEPALRELAMKGIRADSLGSSTDMTGRVVSFSLIDVPADIKELMNKDNLTYEEQQRIYDAVYADDAKVMEDKNGKKGSYIFADCLIPDGYAQGAEVNLSSILDQMGYDCISKADFIGHEDEYWEVINAVKEGIKNGEYGSSGSIHDLYGNTKAGGRGGNGKAPGTWGHHSGGGTSTSGDARANLDRLKEEREQAKAAEKEEKETAKEIKAYREKLMNEKISTYKKENNDQEPTQTILNDFEKEVDIKVKEKFGSKK